MNVWQGGEAARLQPGVWHGGHEAGELGAVRARRPWSVDPSHHHPQRWRAPHRELSGCGPAICLHKGCREPAQRRAQVGVYEWLLPSTSQPPSSSLPPEACPWHVFLSFSCRLAQAGPVATGVPVGVRSGPGGFLSPPMGAPPPGGSVSPPSSPGPQQLGCSRDLGPASHWAQAEPVGAGSPPRGPPESLCGVSGSQAWTRQRDAGQGRSPLWSCRWDGEAVAWAECGLRWGLGRGPEEPDHFLMPFGTRAWPQGPGREPELWGLGSPVTTAVKSRPQDHAPVHRTTPPPTDHTPVYTTTPHPQDHPSHRPCPHRLRLHPQSRCPIHRPRPTYRITPHLDHAHTPRPHPQTTPPRPRPRPQDNAASTRPGPRPQDHAPAHTSWSP